MKRIFKYFYVIFLFLPLCLCRCKNNTNDIENMIVEIHYIPDDFDKEKFKDIYEIDEEGNIIIYRGSKSDFAQRLIKKLVNSKRKILPKMPWEMTKCHLMEGYIYIYLISPTKTNIYSITKDNGLIGDETNRCTRKCDCLHDIYAYFAREKFAEFGFNRSTNTYYNYQGNDDIPHTDGIPRIK